MRNISLALFCLLTRWWFSPCAYAQLSSPAFDPNVYIPTVGKAGEIDTIYGNADEQLMGARARVVKREIDGVTEIALGGYPTKGKQSVVRVGPGFELGELPTRNFNIPLKSERSMIVDIQYQGAKDYFAEPAGNTIPKIYWSDNQGHFDSSRYTQLWLAPNRFADMVYMKPFIAPLAQDSVCDIVCLVREYADSLHKDRMYLAFFHGGEKLISKGKVAFADSIVLFDSIVNPSKSGFINMQGDFRGTGRDDLIAYSGFGSYFYYRNVEPFALTKLVSSLHFDTLASRWENLSFDPPYTSLIMRGLPKAPEDSSKDLLIAFNERNADGSEGHYWHIYMFRGGDHFGETRLKLNQPDFLLRSPEFYDPNFMMGFANTLFDCGDLTGQGLPVLGTTGVAGGIQTTDYFYYVLGESIDDKVDMFIRPEAWGIPTMIPVTADNDQYGDLLMTLPMFGSFADLEKGKDWVGSIWMVHGSSEIPIMRNRVKESKLMSVGVSVMPNPFCNYLQVDVNSDLNSQQHTMFEVKLFDLLGNIVRQGTTESEIVLDTKGLSSGAYLIEVSSNGTSQRKKLILSK